MKYNHHCKACDIYFAFLIEKEPKTDEEKMLCEEYDSETLLQEPLNKEEEAQGNWMYSDSCNDWTDIPSTKDEIEEYEFCPNCIRFIKKRI